MKSRIEIAAALMVVSVLSAAASGELLHSLNGQGQFAPIAAAATRESITVSGKDGRTLSVLIESPPGKSAGGGKIVVVEGK